MARGGGTRGVSVERVGGLNDGRMVHGREDEGTEGSKDDLPCTVRQRSTAHTYYSLRLAHSRAVARLSS